jgi:hypothetical protein
MSKLVFACGTAAVFLCSAATPLRAQDADDRARAELTVKEVMEKTITPATNTLWNPADSPTDEQWAALEE